MAYGETMTHICASLVGKGLINVLYYVRVPLSHLISLHVCRWPTPSAAMSTV